MVETKELENEKTYLKEVFSEIQSQKSEAKSSLEKYQEELKRQISYSADSFYNMDEEELSATKTILENQELDVIKRQEFLNRLNLLEKSAYFGRVDFNQHPYYIGIASLVSDKEKLYVSDWRAPVSSLYYDYELGEGKYDSPNGEIIGQITKKRQYKVKKDQLIYAIDSSLTIGDEILKETLSAGASDKMKNIVSTIQKEQNKIIRSSEAKNLLIQGEAGSGKTSIAMHRAAYLLYKKTGRLNASDIMIISPNRLFSEYISNILPELGERNIIETTFNNLAAVELPKIKICNREESLNKALEDSQFAKVIEYKNSFKFFDELKSFLDNFSTFNFEAKDVVFNEKIIKKEVIQELYSSKYKSKKVSVRLGWIADHVIDGLKLPTRLYSRILYLIYNMFSKKSMLEIYADFLNSKKINFNPNTRKIFFEDAPAILYIKDYILGLENKQDIKYLLIDEMQDYNPIHYDIFNKLFDCNKLILGDINQNIFEIYRKEDLEKLCGHIGNCELIKLTKSYRSTYEISTFCQEIKGLNYSVVDRHGMPVQQLKLSSEKEEIDKIRYIFNKNKGRKVALICKNQKEAEKYYEFLKNDAVLIDNDLEISSDNVIISGINAKGIEFDVVIIPNHTKENYSNEIDNNIFYISATRALHELYILSVI